MVKRVQSWRPFPRRDEAPAEQRITELYTRAVDQLGAEKAPVRLGGLHALERLAQNNPTQRQTIVDVICSYLRMPYTAPPDRPHVHSGVYRNTGPRRRRHRTLTDRPPASPTPTLRYQQAREEGQVRLTAQRILSAHLNPEVASVFWDDIDLNLTEAHLHQLDLSACHIRSAQFDGATFTGYARFGRATFTGNASFDEATFTGYAEFNGAEFAGNAWFSEATFTGDAFFGGAKFAVDAWFIEATFTGHAWFSGATFVGNAVFNGARVSPRSSRVGVPMEWVTRSAAEGEEEGWLYLVHEEDSSEQPAEAPGDAPT